MDFEVEDIPVSWLDTRVGTARLVEDDYGVRVDIRLDARVGVYLRDTAEKGILTGLTIGTEEVRPATSFYQGRAHYGEGPRKAVLPEKVIGEETGEK